MAGAIPRMNSPANRIPTSIRTGATIHLAAGHSFVILAIIGNKRPNIPSTYHGQVSSTAAPLKAARLYKSAIRRTPRNEEGDAGLRVRNPTHANTVSCSRTVIRMLSTA